MSEERLVSKTKDSSGEEMPEKLHELMFNIEEAFKMAGARAKHDYAYTDLMNYAVQLFNSGNNED